MNRDDLVTVLVAVCCIGAAGISATTLESTLSEDPDDVIELQYGQLPPGEEAADEEGRQNDARDGGAAARQPREVRVDPVTSVFDRLWSLAPFLAALAALGLAYRHRDRLVAVALALGAWRAGTSPAGAPPDRQWAAEPPDDEVHRAWLSMVRRLDLSQPESRTPLECARAAVDAGMDPQAVETLTRVFEEVRYGDRPVTEERRERAREGLRQLGGEPP